MYVDIHTHLTHEKFSTDCDEVIEKSIKNGLGAVVINGLEPQSNRQILALQARFPVVKAALGIYPIEGIGHLAQELPFSVSQFDVDKEIEFIRTAAKDKKIAAVGECGLDGYWVGEATFPEQERIFESLIEIALGSDLPLIIHTRKREQRSIDILEYHGVTKVNFHCFGGKVKLALKASEKNGWKFSIPANANKNEAFRKMLAELPPECILTETDAPYLSPVKGERNEPSNVIGTIDILAELRGWSHDKAKETVWNNYLSLMGDCSS